MYSFLLLFVPGVRKHVFGRLSPFHNSVLALSPFRKGCQGTTAENKMTRAYHVGAFCVFGFVVRHAGLFFSTQLLYMQEADAWNFPEILTSDKVPSVDPPASECNRFTFRPSLVANCCQIAGENSGPWSKKSDKVSFQTQLVPSMS